MARNIKDILKIVSGRVNSNELSAALSASNPFEVEFDDSTFTEIETQIKGLTTLEEAKNNQEIFEALKPKIERNVENDLRKKFKAETLHGVETELGKIAGKIGIQADGKKWNEIVSEISNKAESFNGNADERVVGLTGEVEKLHKKVANLQEARKTEKEEYETKFSTFQTDAILRKEIEANIPLAKPYQEQVVKEGLINRFIDLAKSKASITLENGSLKLLNPDNPELELYGENNQKAGLLDLIGTEAQPYIAAKQEPNGSPAPRESQASESPYAVGSPADAMKRQKEAFRDGLDY